MVKNCENCNQLFTARRIRRSWSRCCSVQCAGENKSKPLTAGQRSGRLTFIREQGRDRHSHMLIDVQCDCGTSKTIAKCSFTSGQVRSCGCLRIEAAALNGVKHRMNKTPEHRTYLAARNRCNNRRGKDWSSYGGRGIEFRFTSFQEFFAEMGPRPSKDHSIDRKDANGHYEAGNVRWATRKQQSNNRRCSPANRKVAEASI